MQFKDFGHFSKPSLIFVLGICGQWNHSARPVNMMCLFHEAASQAMSRIIKAMFMRYVTHYTLQNGRVGCNGSKIFKLFLHYLPKLFVSGLRSPCITKHI